MIKSTKLKFVIFQSDNNGHWKPPCEPIFYVYQLLSLAHLSAVVNVGVFCNSKYFPVKFFQEKIFARKIGQILPRAQWGKPELQQQIDSGGCDCSNAAHQCINLDCLCYIDIFQYQIGFCFSLTGKKNVNFFSILNCCEFVSLYLYCCISIGGKIAPRTASRSN